MTNENATLYTREMYYLDLMKNEDRLYLDEGLRIEQLSKAIEKFGLEEDNKPQLMYIKDGKIY